jgi:hypothetical protein
MIANMLILSDTNDSASSVTVLRRTVLQDHLPATLLQFVAVVASMGWDGI